MNVNHVLDLDDIVLAILPHLDYKDIVRCRGVSRLWHALISKSATLRYIVYLGINERVDGSASASPYSVSARLDALLALEEAWRTLDFRRRDTYSSRTGDHLRLVGFDTYESSQMSTEAVRLSADRLPSIISGVEQPQLGDVITVDPNEFDDFFIDADNELLVLESRRDDQLRARKRFHLRFLYDQDLDHPLASQPVLETGPLLNFAPDATLRMIRTMTVGNLLLVEIQAPVRTPEFRITREESVIIIWNWITGEIMMRLVLQHRTRNYADLSLLSSRSFMLPIIDNLPSGQLNALVEVYDFSGELPLDSDGFPKPKLVRTFFLAPLPKDVSELEFTCCSSLTNGGVWMQSGEQRSLMAHTRHSARRNKASIAPVPPKPFRPADNDRMCALILETPLTHTPDSPLADLPYSHTFFTRASTFLSSDYSSDWVPWKEWGPHRTACLHGPTSELRWGNFWHPHGSRIVLARHNVAPANAAMAFGRAPWLKWSLEVLDFAPDRVRRHVLLSEHQQNSWPPVPPALEAVPGPESASANLSVATEADPGSSSASGQMEQNGGEGTEHRHSIMLIDHTDSVGSPGHGYHTFAQWNVETSLPYIRTRLESPRFPGQWLELDMDMERIVINETFLNIEGDVDREVIEILTM